MKRDDNLWCCSSKIFCGPYILIQRQRWNPTNSSTDTVRQCDIPMIMLYEASVEVWYLLLLLHMGNYYYHRPPPTFTNRYQIIQTNRTNLTHIQQRLIQIFINESHSERYPPFFFNTTQSIVCVSYNPNSKKCHIIQKYGYFLIWLGIQCGTQFGHLLIKISNLLGKTWEREGHI